LYFLHSFIEIEGAHTGEESPTASTAYTPYSPNTNLDDLYDEFSEPANTPI